MLTILVTGGAGFIGTNLCNELRKRGHMVIACDLYNTDRDDYIRCDVRNFRQIENVFNKFGPFEFVYHLALVHSQFFVLRITKRFSNRCSIENSENEDISSFSKNLV